VHKPSSIFQALQVLSEFGRATGLHQNPQKLKGLICSRSSPDVTHEYPYINWSYDFIEVLNIPFGSQHEIQRLFSAKLQCIKSEIIRLKKFRTTYDAKSIIIRMKILPMLTFVSRIYCFPNSLIRKLNRIVLNYVLPKSTSLTIFELSNPREKSGYQIFDVPVFLQLLYVKQVKTYYFNKSGQYERFSHLFLFEYNVGRVLDKKYNLCTTNSIPHAFKPLVFYKK